LCKTVIFGTELAENVEGVLEELQSRGLNLVSMGDDSPEYARAFESEAADVPVTRISRAHRNCKFLCIHCDVLVIVRQYIVFHLAVFLCMTNENCIHIVVCVQNRA
jgi:hypothetical protein